MVIQSEATETGCKYLHVEVVRKIPSFLFSMYILRFQCTSTYIRSLEVVCAFPSARAASEVRGVRPQLSPNDTKDPPRLVRFFVCRLDGIDDDTDV